MTDPTPEQIRAASSLVGRQGKGKPKRLTAAERATRGDRLRKAQAQRAEQMRKAKDTK